MDEARITELVSKVLGAYEGSSKPADVAAPQSKADSVGEDVVAQAVAKILSQSGSAPAAARTFVPNEKGCSWKEAAPAVNDGLGEGVFATMDDAVKAAKVAQRQYLLCTMQDRARFVDGVRAAILEGDTVEKISRMTVEQTGMGTVEHKIIKNRLAATKTPGVEDLTTEALSGDDGLTLVELSPYGVIGSITPTTNPTETIICNSIGMLAAGNSVVYSPHPRAREVSLLTIRLINRKLAELGAPANLVVTVDQPSIENTQAMMKHPDIRMLVATGGPGIVRTVMSTGKKAIGAGAGNPPVVVDETADIEKAARDIVNGCSFDNNLPCIAEKEVIAVEQIADFLIFNMKRCGAQLIEDPAIVKKLEALVINEKGGPKTSCVGKSARYLLEQVGVTPDPDVKVILIDLPAEHPFVQVELMMPILPLVRVANVDSAIDLAVDVEHGNRHTAMMHSTNVRKLTKMAKLIQTTIFVKNGPSYAGIGVGGMGHTTFTIAGPTGEGLTSARSFARHRRCVMVESLNVR